ncbi:Agamous-like MADS-box protein AGL21 [Acorus calamus]|uniref:Agamous-like MADS-box protein AGL21 n=1 Tax=Acorus calamus TaxID=4465 RepID=A0AAV9DJG7_ACOCL|nr:Agamous-like MADS-box protein AGL21 [Acorus calamus]
MMQFGAMADMRDEYQVTRKCMLITVPGIDCILSVINFMQNINWSSILYNISMKSVIDRYNKAKEEHNQVISSTSEVKVHLPMCTWLGTDELSDDMQHKYVMHVGETRRIMGKELSGLCVKDLQNLETQLEMSLRGDQLLTDEIQELNKKGNLVHQENMELYKKVNLIRQENMELYKKVYGTREASEGISRHPFLPNCFSIREDIHAPINLELSQPQSQNYEMPARATKLGFTKPKSNLTHKKARSGRLLDWAEPTDTAHRAGFPANTVLPMARLDHASPM